MAKPVITDVHAEPEVSEQYCFLFRTTTKFVSILWIQLLIKHGECFLKRMRNDILGGKGMRRDYDYGHAKEGREN